MKTTNSINFAGFSNVGAILSVGSDVKNYTSMKEPVSAKPTNRSGSVKNQSNQKKRKNYYAKLLDMLSRKTESEKRIELFGSDPFK
jgi:hypothetical protein